MQTMFSGYERKCVPKNFKECYAQDNVSCNLWQWGERIEIIGKIACIILVIIGIIVSIKTAYVTTTVVNETKSYSYDDDYDYYDDDDDDTITSKTQFDTATFITSLITYAIYAFLEYCAYHILALLICSLASIVQNTNITANVALYDSKSNEENTAHSDTAENPTNQKESTKLKEKVFKDTETPKSNGKNYRETSTGSVICENCNSVQPSGRNECYICGAKFN